MPYLLQSFSPLVFFFFFFENWICEGWDHPSGTVVIPGLLVCHAPTLLGLLPDAKFPKLMK